MSRLLQTDIAIAAPPEVVWSILTDFTAYPGWNPFIRRISGKQEVGARLDVDLAPPGGRVMTIRPSVLEVGPQRSLRWLGSVWWPGLFDGEHRFVIEPLGKNQSRFLQSERFSGPLVPLVMPFIGRSTQQGFEAMNQALKERAEAMAHGRTAQVA
ncbi:MAG: SRPBCC domain-containing protein [Thermomicrobiales bacterium]